MNAKALLVLLSITTLLFAASLVLNLLQYAQARQIPWQQARQNLERTLRDTRVVGALVENNTAEGYIVLRYQEVDGLSQKIKIALSQNTALRRTGGTLEGDVFTKMSVVQISQSDLVLGQEVYALISGAASKDRLEANTIVVGDLLPTTR